MLLGGGGGEGASGSTITTNETEATDEITALARALQYDPKLIYEYVRNHIAYDPPTYGLANGANGCLLAGRGNDWDQAALLVSLLRVSGYTTRFVKGVVEYSRSDLANWLGVPPNKIGELLGNGGHFFTEYPASCKMNRLWVESEIGTNWYTFDPSFKEYEDVVGINLASAMGYTQAAFLASATQGATVTNDYVQNINETNINALLTTYATNLLKHIKTHYANSRTDEIIGGRRLVAETLTNYTTELPHALSVQETNTYDNVPDTNNIIVSIAHCGLSHTFRGYEIAGKRVSLFYATNDYRPELRLDGQLVATGDVTTAGTTNDLTISYSHPYATDSYLDGTNTHRVVSGSRIVLVLDFVGASPRLLAKQDRELQRNACLGTPDSSEAVSGGRLQVTATAGLIQWLASEFLISRVTGLKGFAQQHLGVIGEQYGGGCFMDLPALIVSGAGSSEKKTAWFESEAFFGSALEHGSWEQSQGGTNEFGSTVKLLKISNGQGKRTYYATATNWTSVVKPALTNYTPGMLADIGYNITNHGFTYLLPQDGHIEFGDWAGVGLVAADWASESIGMLISGGYEGAISWWYQQTVGGVVISTTVFFSNGSSITYAGTPTYQLTYGLTPSQQTLWQNATSYTPPISGEPVDLQTGDYIYRHSDLAMGNREPLGLDFKRTYHSGMNYCNAGLGYGWTHRYNGSIRETSDGKLGFGLRQPSDAVALIAQSYVCQDLLKNQAALGRDWTISALAAKWAMDQLIGTTAEIRMGDVSAEYVRMPDGSYVSPPGETATLHKDGGGFGLEVRFGQVMTFDTNGLITAWRDADSNDLTFTYTTSNRLYQVADAFGRTLTLSYSSGLVISVADSSGRSVGFDYSNGNLISSTDPQSYTTVYSYDTNGEHLLTAIHNPVGELIITNEYNALGKVESQVNGAGNTWNFYISGFRSVEENPQGGQITYLFDENGWNIATEDAMSNQVWKFYDVHPHLTRIVDARGHATLLQYDGDLNLTNIVDAMTNSTAMGYDQHGHLVSVRDALGNVSSNEYDNEHHQTRAIDALGHRTDLNYYESGLLHTLTDPRQNVTTYTYDTNGQPHTVQRTDGGTITNEFNTLGDLLTYIDANTHLARYTYDKRRLLTGVRDAAGYTVSNIYDGAQRLIRTVDARNNPRSFSYTPTMYNLKTITNANEGVVQNLYDRCDRLVSTTDPLGGVTSNRYDAAGRVVVVIDALGHQVKYGYDENGNVTAITNALEKTWFFSYDALNRLVGVTDPLDHDTAYEYDKLGRLLGVTDANGLKTEHEVDALGRVTAVTKPDGVTEHFEYDENGNLSAFVNGEGARTTFAYDGMNRMVTTTNAELIAATYTYDPVGNVLARKDGNGTTNQYQYDFVNNMAQVTYPNASTAAFLWDGNRRLTNATDSVGKTTYIYDDMGWLVAVTDRHGNAISYTYDLKGRRTSLAYPGNKVVSNLYDTADRLMTVRDWNGRETSYSYDNVNDPVGILYPNTVAGTNIWDEALRLSSLQYGNGGGAIISRAFTRDNVGNKIQENITAGLVPSFQPAVQRLTQDAADRLDYVYEKATPDAASWTTNQHIYDANGNLLSDSSALTIQYDFNDMPTNFVTASFTNQYDYDPLGDRTRRVVNGVTYIDILDKGAALHNVLLTTDGSGNPVRYYLWGRGLIAHMETNGATYYYHSDELRSTLALTDTNGVVAGQYAYGPYGQVANNTGTVDTAYKWIGGYGVWSEGSGIYHMKARYYSADLKRFVAADPIGISGLVGRGGNVLNLHSYANDNPGAFIDPLGWCGDSPSTVPPSLPEDAGIEDATFDILGIALLFGTGGSSAAAKQGVSKFVLSGVGKAEARVAVDSMGLTAAQSAAAKSAITRATATSSIKVTQSGADVVVQVFRAGEMGGYQVIESVVNPSGAKSVVQKGYSAAGKVTHYDVKR